MGPAEYAVGSFALHFHCVDTSQGRHSIPDPHYQLGERNGQAAPLLGSQQRGAPVHCWLRAIHSKYGPYFCIE